MASTTHDPIYNQLTYYSTAQAPYCDWRKQSPSTDRTISVPETTAATSLQSQVSNGYHISSLDYGAISQKRKRTRAVALDEVKQTMRELNHDDNPLSLYQPPPNTVIKAKNVHVQVVLDKSHIKHQVLDDKDEHYVVVPNVEFTERYQIVKLLGQGTFGKVARAYDREKGTKRAIKIIRSVPKYRDASRIELRNFTYNRTVPSSSNTVKRSARRRKVLLEPGTRLIDFGSATFNDEYHSSVVSTRHCCAPEIILNLVESFTGDTLFQTYDNLQHLAMMEAMCGGKIDPDIVRPVYKQDRGSSRHSANSAARYSKYYELDYLNAETRKGSNEYVKAMKKLPETISSHTDFSRQFLDLLRRIFVYDPKKRTTAEQVLQHPWFKEPLMDDSTYAYKLHMEQEKTRGLKQNRHYRHGNA
ncbi:hypothetical protein HBH98_244050 [Parastagonospora nodorum]|nr:hypothetical protein HBH53_230510 [Parastagonospora nodorum]KAH3956353.1 hypothetical protein HBH51_243850 [Parastagonospora nodorum]KAH4215524.1 hypothetical protein HBI06_247900 [Parastagonospora nodorum]KAH4224214.1 hypothetical protein HBI05_242050 [Parastagonospora nodorum]KAH4334266.1 hypothetical protein HBH98_244050 [Parastagonospora nodorum]